MKIKFFFGWNVIFFLSVKNLFTNYLIILQLMYVINVKKTVKTNNEDTIIYLYGQIFTLLFVRVMHSVGGLNIITAQKCSRRDC